MGRGRRRWSGSWLPLPLAFPEVGELGAESVKSLPEGGPDEFRFLLAGAGPPDLRMRSEAEYANRQHLVHKNSCAVLLCHGVPASPASCADRPLPASGLPPARHRHVSSFLCPLLGRPILPPQVSLPASCLPGQGVMDRLGEAPGQPRVTGTTAADTSLFSFFPSYPGAQMVKNPPACRRPGSDPGVAAHSSLLACRIPETEGPGGYSPWGRTLLLF